MSHAVNEENQLFLLLGRLEGKVDAFLSAQEKHESRMDALEARVSSLETFKSKGVGVYLAVVTAATIVSFLAQLWINQ